jgi:hypothetical protein
MNPLLVNALRGYPHSTPMLPPPVARIAAQCLAGFTYEFEMHSAGTTLWNLPGVYVLAYLGSDGLFYAGYIGEAERLNDRVGFGLARHEKWERARNWGATHVGVMIVGGDRAQRLQVETALRHAYNPPLNDQ